jgi:ABC-type bacteriocin/lantibiotic exporter with double-glycine peptidase domain
MSRKIPYHRQANEWYCGPATLQMALGAFGIRASQRVLARASGTNTKNGTPRAGLVRTLRAKGLRSEARHGRSLAELAKTVREGRVTVVLYIEPEGEAHYAVLTAVGRRRVLLHDPWHGPRYSLPRAEFLKRWRGTAKRWPRWAMIVDKPPVT